MIIGTAGHIDHGKSALVTALTGKAMDRLAEERRRGITIDLNFAPLELEGLVAAGIVGSHFLDVEHVIAHQRSPHGCDHQSQCRVPRAGT